MALPCSCPRSAYLTTIADTTCEFDFKKIKKMFFSRERIFQGVTSPPTITTIATFAEWATTLAAVDSTKTVVTPNFIKELTITPGEPDVESIEGSDMIVGYKNSMVDFKLISQDPDTITTFKDMQCEHLYVGFINEEGKLIHGMDGTQPILFRIEPGTFKIKDPTGGWNTKNKTECSFQLGYGYADTAELTVPVDFDALIDLTN